MNTENPKKAVAIAFSIIVFLGGAYTINEYFFDDEAESPVHGNYDKTMVNICEPDGDKLSSVTAAIADTTNLQHTGLSNTDYLPEDHGMLFVFDDVRERVFWMKDMDFPIDIIYADNERVITSIHHAKAPTENGSGTEPHHQYSGVGQYVLEVNYGWTENQGINNGDILKFDLNSDHSDDEKN